MTFTKYFNDLRISLMFFLFVFTVATVTATARSNDAAVGGLGVERIGVEESYTIAARGLAKKMETDLVLSDVKVKFSQIERYAVSKTQIGLRGAGTCQLSGEKAELPIHFDVKINASSRNVAEVNYNFVESGEAETENAGAMTDDESFAAKQLFEKIKADYKTDHIVIAIDYLDDNKTASAGAKALSGAGEVRLGDLVWKKISFEIVAADDQSGKPSEVKYKIQ